MNKSTKWYNWVGDSYWDDYCRAAWTFLFGPFFIGMGLLIVWGIVEAIL